MPQRKKKGGSYMDEMQKTLEFCEKAKKVGKVVVNEKTESSAKEIPQKKKKKKVEEEESKKKKTTTSKMKKCKTVDKPKVKKKATPPKRKKSKIKRGRLNATNSPGSRYLSSLGVLTKNFVELLQNTENGTIDLNKAAEKLGVQKRRIYDITNVLEGIRLIEKKPKGNIFWLGSTELDPDAEKKVENLKNEIKKLTAQAQVLDLDLHQMISVVKRQMSDESFTEKAYITLNDVKILKCFEDATVMAIKAPMGTTLEVPDPDSFEGENGQRRYNIYLKSFYGPIDVFLVSSGNDQDENETNEGNNGTKRKSTTSTNNLGSNRKRRKRTSSMSSVPDTFGSPGKSTVDIPIPSPIKLGSNQTPLKLGSLSPFFPRAFMGSSSVETPMKFESEKRNGIDPSIVSNDRLIQLLPAFDTAAGYGMAIMDDSEGISDLFSPKHAFDPVSDTSASVLAVGEMDEDIQEEGGASLKKAKRTKKRKK